MQRNLGAMCSSSASPLPPCSLKDFKSQCFSNLLSHPEEKFKLSSFSGGSTPLMPFKNSMPLHLYHFTVHTHFSCVLIPNPCCQRRLHLWNFASSASLCHSYFSAASEDDVENILGMTDGEEHRDGTLFSRTDVNRLWSWTAFCFMAIALLHNL